MLHGCATYDSELWFTTFRRLPKKELSAPISYTSFSESPAKNSQVSQENPNVPPKKPYMSSMSQFRFSIDSWNKAPIGELIFYWGSPDEIREIEKGVEVYRYMRIVDFTKWDEESKYGERKTAYQVFCRTDIKAKNGLINASESYFSTGVDDDGDSFDDIPVLEQIEGVMNIISIFSGDDDDEKNTSDCSRIDPWPTRHDPRKSMRTVISLD